MSFGFNKQFKKDDTVSKLKNLQDLKDTHLKTRQLENDKRKMEERLQELRMAMEIEKEERIKKSPGGGAFWTAGVEGPVVNHAQNVLNQNDAPDISKVKKIVVLKDEPSPTASKSALVARPPPGTLAHIANRSAVPHPKVLAAASQQNGTLSSSSCCGQCETQLATMHCRECGENFCRGCFASFHVRGALRGHHPVVVSAAATPPKPDIPLQPRIAFDSPSNIPKPPNAEKAPAKKVKFTSDSPSQASDRSPGMFNIERTVIARQTEDEMSSQTSGSLSYDNQSLNNSFTDEWAAAVNAVAAQLSGRAQASSSTSQTSSNNSGKTPKKSTSGTSTDVENVNHPLNGNPAITEIQFTSTGISYKDRLLINKHRRFELPPPTVMLVPKPPPVPSAGSRRLRQSKEGALSTSTKISFDSNGELPDPLDFDDVEREIMKIDTDGVLLVNGRPGSAISIGSARWEQALETELADDEVMLHTFAKMKEKSVGESLIPSYDAYLIDQIVEISDLSEIVESARTPTVAPSLKEAEIDNGNTPAIDTPSSADTITPKSRPNSSRPVSVKKNLDQMKKIPTKSRAQLSSEFGAHQLSTQPSKELKQAVTSLTNRTNSNIQLRPSSAKVPPAFSGMGEPSPSLVSDFLLMGVENKTSQQQGSSTPRVGTPRPGSSATKQPPTNISVYKICPATWKPFSSVSAEEIDGRDEAKTDEHAVNRAPSPAIQTIVKLNFPEGQRSASKETDEEKDDIDENAVEDDDVTPRNDDVGPSTAFLGRVANSKAAESANKQRVPFAAAISPSPAVPSPRPSSASSLKQNGYAQPRTPLQQSIEAWRAASRQEQPSDDVASNNEQPDESDESEEDEEAGFCGRLATNNNALSSARSAGSTSRQNEQISTSATPRPKSSTIAPTFALSAAQSTGAEEDGEEAEEADAETLRSLTEELKIEASSEQSRDPTTLQIQQEESEIQIPIVMSKMPTEFEDPIQIIEDEQQNSFLNDDDDFDDKMALAELATELQISSSHPTTYPRISGTTANRGSGSGSLANLLHGSLAARDSQATSMTSVTSYWTSSPSNSSSFRTDVQAGGQGQPATAGGVATNNTRDLPVVAEDADRPTSSALSPTPRSGKRSARQGMVFNAHGSQSRGEFAIRQSSLMNDFDDVEKQLDDQQEVEDDEDDEEEGY